MALRTDRRAGIHVMSYIMWHPIRVSGTGVPSSKGVTKYRFYHGKGSCTTFCRGIHDNYLAIDSSRSTTSKYFYADSVAS
ncbi:hypothetical protein PILCRDRAFT_710342 [Piloderma croceum F 1598]|uniref:Uncharacterized protein n=1 Tax=Piloderma croceum (strain F 1598) TaxID=765440 RepID=A0A0C3AJZ4_PILCF|nr:hypothetical protein PILCRDRAFT_710342 [Piloderma croceum F 1598]